MDLNDAHWNGRANGSFTPPFSRRWDFRSGGGGQLPRGHGSSYSSSSKGSRISRMSGSAHHQYSVSDGIVSYFSSPSESFNAHQCWSPMPHGGGDFAAAAAHPESRSASSFQSYKEGCLATGASTCPCSADSASSYSDIGDCDQNAIIHFPPAHKGFSGRYSFMSKPVHPMPFPDQVMETDGQVVNSNRYTSTEWRNSVRWPDNSVHELKPFADDIGSMQAFPELNLSSQRERNGLTSANSPDFGLEIENAKYKNMHCGLGLSTSEVLRCGLCERWLSQKSPWSSHRMIRCGDFPPSGVLSCGHVYHADCLDQTIPESQKHDPPCPSCAGAINTTLVSNIELPASVAGLQAMPASGTRCPRFRIATDDDGLPSCGKQSRARSDYMADIPGKKWHMQMPGCNKKSFLSKTLSKKHFFKGKSTKEITAEDFDSKNAGSTLNIHHDIKSADNCVAGCSRG